MLKIGLTGGIGSGKSIVANYFAQLKVPVSDADKIAHEFFKPNTTTYKKIISHFGKDFLTSKKLLNRKKLGAIIFSNKKERIWLEKLLHPRVRQKMQRWVAKTNAPYCIMVIPLLFETKFPPKVDRFLVIDCSKKIQLKRICERDDGSIKRAQAIIKSQINSKLRRQKADDIIYNNGSLKSLKKAIKFLHYYYLSLASKHGIMS